MWVWMKKEEAYIAPEFDYEKLADALVAANKRAKEKEESNKASGALIKIALTSLFWVFTLICIGVSLFCCYTVIKNVRITQDVVTFLKFLFVLLVLAVIFSIGILSFRAGKEVLEEKNYERVVSLFACITSLMAAVVSFIALSQGVLQ